MTAAGWLDQLVEVLPHVRGEDFSRFLPPASGGRHSAVLVLFGEGAAGPDLLLIERAHTLREHAGQPAFPGGALDPGDGDPTGTGPVQAALREAAEEVGLQPHTVQVLGQLPPLYLPPSGFVVHSVIAWWRTPHPVGVVDPAEVAGVVRVPIADLVDPANRLSVRHPSGWVGPGFEVGGLLVWGFTAGVLDRLLSLGGWERPWDPARSRTLDPQPPVTSGGPQPLAVPSAGVSTAPVPPAGAVPETVLGRGPQGPARTLPDGRPQTLPP